VARIIALDIGAKRTGIAVTDPMQMIATGLEGIQTNDLVHFLKQYVALQSVEIIVVGKPMQMNYTESESWEYIEKVAQIIGKNFPDIQLVFYDERFTSKIAVQSMKTAGAGKDEMKNKKTVDMVSATVLLQSYMESLKG
jgi:putative Holliday junction resolvase